MPGTFSPPPRVSDCDMHHGTCVTHVPWCMLGSLTSGFLWSRWRERRSRHSQRMRNPQLYVSGKRPMAWSLLFISFHLIRSIYPLHGLQLRGHNVFTLQICYNQLKLINWTYVRLKLFNAVSLQCGRFKNAHELLNGRAPKFSTLYKYVSFNVSARYFLWNIKGILWKQKISQIHWNIHSSMGSKNLATAVR